MKLGNAIVQNMFGVPYPVLTLEHLWVVQIIIQRLKMLAPIVHIQTTKGAQVLKLDMALQTCFELYSYSYSTLVFFENSLSQPNISQIHLDPDGSIRIQSGSHLLHV